MARAITIEELKEARKRYAEDIRKLEEAGPNPKYRITAAQISRLIDGFGRCDLAQGNCASQRVPLKHRKRYALAKAVIAQYSVTHFLTVMISGGCA
jgi:hypothetical protein